MMTLDLTKGNITKTLLLFALPMMVGNLLQQTYNVVDTLIVGQYIGRDALAAVGSAYTLMTFLNSVLLGFCMGSGVMSFVMIGALTLFMNGAVFLGLDWILVFLKVPYEVYDMMREYLQIIFWGITSVFVYNYFASLLRAVGNSVVPLIFLGVSAVTNIVLDLEFVLKLGRGIGGAAEATVLSQIFSAVGICIYTLARFPQFRLGRKWMVWNGEVLKEIFHLSFLTSVQ